MIKLKPIEPCYDQFNDPDSIDIMHKCGRDDALCPDCLEKDRDRYKELFELSMDFIDKSPGDPDVYDDQVKAWIKLQEKINEEMVFKDLVSKGLARVEEDINKEIIRIAKENGVKIVMEKNIKAPDISTVYRCKVKDGE